MSIRLLMHFRDRQIRLFHAVRLALIAFVLTNVFATEDRRSLDGIWAFTIDPARLEQPLTAWDTMPVPGNWDTYNTYSQHVGKGWYRREFSIPPEWKGRRVRVHFGAVYETAEVWLNGRPLGRHEGGYTDFDYDITEALRWDRTNAITVSADNTYRRGAWWGWGGISRSVTLLAHDPVRLVRQHIRAEPDLAGGIATVHIEYLIANDRPAAVDIEIAATALFTGAEVGRSVIRAKIPPNAAIREKAVFTMPPERVRHWHFDHPHLYHLKSQLSADGTIRSERQDRFGIRKIEVKPDGLYLNGERVRLTGFNRVHDHRAYGNTEPEHLVRLDVDRMKRYGGNFMRIMHAPAAPNLLDYLDERGVMVFTEIPVWGDKDPNVIADNPRTKQWLREMVERDYNHPSIIGWSVGNELLNHFDYVKTMIDFTRRELDPYRLISYVSYSGARPAYTAENDPISVSDLILHNTYGPDPGRLVETLAEKWPNRPVFLSEFGARQFGETPDSRIPGLDERWQTLAGRPHLIGVALWTYNDYRSNYAGSAAGELRSWGIVDLWRRDKAAARDIARLHSPIRRLELRDGQAWIEPRSADEFPAFTLRGYHLLWEWRTPEGLTRGGGVAALPEIAPGAQPVKIALAGAPSDPDARNLVITLLSPLGYVAHETATIPRAEPPPAPVVTASSAPVIHQAYPLDGGFMLGYSTHFDDTAFTLEYGTQPGSYSERMTISQKGAFAIHGLENGRRYYGRLRRELAASGPSAWSSEFSVAPDGGLPPAPPAILGVVRGADRIAVRFSPVSKATGYRLRWGENAGEARLIQAAEATTIVLTDLEPARTYTFRVSAIGAHGESEFSAPHRSSPVR